MADRERQLPLGVKSEIAKIVRNYVVAARGNDLTQEQEVR